MRSYPISDGEAVCGLVQVEKQGLQFRVSCKTEGKTGKLVLLAGQEVIPLGAVFPDGRLVKRISAKGLDEDVFRFELQTVETKLDSVAQLRNARYDRGSRSLIFQTISSPTGQ